MNNADDFLTVCCAAGLFILALTSAVCAIAVTAFSIYKGW